MSHYLIFSNLSVNKPIDWIAFAFLSQILSVCLNYLSMTEWMCVCALMCLCNYLYDVGAWTPWQKLLCVTAGTVSSAVIKYEMSCRVIHTCCAHEAANQSQCLTFYWHRCGSERRQSTSRQGGKSLKEGHDHCYIDLYKCMILKYFSLNYTNISLINLYNLILDHTILYIQYYIKDLSSPIYGHDLIFCWL